MLPASLPVRDPVAVGIAAVESPSMEAAQSASARKHSQPHKRPRSSSPRLVVGQNAISRLHAELERLHLNAPLIVSSSSCSALSESIQSSISSMDSPIISADNFSAVACVVGRDCVISVGGESSHVLAQAVSLRDNIPHVCIPTTYSGTDMICGSLSRRSKHSNYTDNISRASSNTTGKLKLKFRPAVIIYDEDLTNCTTTTSTMPFNENTTETPDQPEHFMTEVSNRSFLQP